MSPKKPVPDLIRDGNRLSEKIMHNKIGEGSMRAIYAAAMLVLLLTGAAQASYPETVVRILVGFPAGTAPDVAARLIADKMAADFGKPVVVENLSGASGNIACDRVAKAPPDGYTLVMCGNGSLVVAPSLYQK